MGNPGEVHAHSLRTGPQLQVPHTESVPPLLWWVSNLRKVGEQWAPGLCPIRVPVYCWLAFLMVIRVVSLPLSLQSSKHEWDVELEFWSFLPKTCKDVVPLAQINPLSSMPLVIVTHHFSQPL